jgi:hypothetical protein
LFPFHHDSNNYYLLKVLFGFAIIVPPQQRSICILSHNREKQAYPQTAPHMSTTASITASSTTYVDDGKHISKTIIVKEAVTVIEIETNSKTDAGFQNREDTGIHV